jgi:osmotically inducible protein OsmC
MAIAERTAETAWKGPLASGGGTIRPACGALGELPVTWASRTGQPGGKTSPEELAVAAHSSCFPVSRLFVGAKISVTATLDPAP